jgi:hypothetical protein
MKGFNVSAAAINAYLKAAQSLLEPLARPSKASIKRKERAGFTKNHSQGTPKAKRKMAAASRHRNRGKA